MGEQRGRKPGPTASQQSRWLDNLATVDAFFADRGHPPRIDTADPEERRLGVWIGTQRANGKNQKLSSDRLATLEESEWWDKAASRSSRRTRVWQERFDEVVDFVDTHGFLPEDKDDPRCRWVQKQVSEMHAGTLDAERKEKLGWSGCGGGRFARAPLPRGGRPQRWRFRKTE